jgi:hypothetical protein
VHPTPTRERAPTVRDRLRDNRQPKRFMTVLADAFDTTRRTTTTLGEADVTTTGRIKAPLPSHWGHKSLAKPSAELHSRLGSEP